MSHFLPSRLKEGGLSMGPVVFWGTEDAAEVLNGAGPDLNAGFLCDCMSFVTFFSPETDSKDRSRISRAYNGMGTGNFGTFNALDGLSN